MEIFSCESNAAFLCLNIKHQACCACFSGEKQDFSPEKLKSFVHLDEFNCVCEYFTVSLSVCVIDVLV